MAEWMNRRANRREQIRETISRASGTWQTWIVARLSALPVFAAFVFVGGAFAIALLAEDEVGYRIGQRIEQPIYARVDFSVEDEERTKADREAARAATPSYYSPNASALTHARIRSELMLLHKTAGDAANFDEFTRQVADKGWPVDAAAYEALRGLTDETGRTDFSEWVKTLPLEKMYVFRGLNREARTPASTADLIRLETRDDDGSVRVLDISHRQLIQQTNDPAMEGSAAAVAEKFPLAPLRSTIKALILDAFREQPTIVFNQERTVEEMRRAEEAAPVVMRKYEKAKPFVNPGITNPEEYDLLKAHHAAYLDFMHSELPGASQERRARILQTGGYLALIAILSFGLLLYSRLNHEQLYGRFSQTFSFVVLLLGTLLAARLLYLRFPQLREAILVPVLVTACVFPIVYPRRFAMGAVCILAVLVCTMVKSDLALLLNMLTGAAAAVWQLKEIRSRTKFIVAGTATAMTVMTAAAAGSLWMGDSWILAFRHGSWGAAAALLAFLIVSGSLPMVERIFSAATALTLLEWRDPARPLLQLLATRAAGTYNHSVVLGTLAEAACEHIGANGLLAYVGALYHDVGKISKADYFTENQVGPVSRHDKLAPTMSLLIILGHVKDGIELAREYKLPKVLHQFIEEHHGTTVVRYFHHVASEKQPLIASGKHDREVPEAEFRYPGPKPQTRESAVLMMCDSVEGAVRALPEPTPTRIETTVHQLIHDRLNDGQFDDCDISLKEIRLVEESLVKSLCSIHHGRIAYPKTRKPEAEEPVESESESVSV